MKRNRISIGWIFFGLTWALLGVASAQSGAVTKPASAGTVNPPVEAEEGAGSPAAAAKAVRIVGKLPGKDPEIGLEASGTPLAQLLPTLAQKAGWNLILDLPEALAQKKITLTLSRVPASEVFRTVLELADLRAEVKDRVVVVRPASPAEGGVEVKIDGAFHGHTRGHPGQSSEDRVVFGQSLRIEKGESVNDAVAVGGSVVVAGHVRGSAVAVGGSVTLEPGAVVEDEAVSIGGAIDVQPGALLSGNRVSISGSVGGVITKAVSFFSDRAAHEGKETGFALPWGFSKWGPNLTLLVLALLVVLLMPARVDRIAGTLRERPGASALVGLALLFGFAPVCLLFVFTIIGIPLIPLLVLIFVALHLLGMTAFLGLVGEKLPWLRDRKAPWLTTLLGFVVFALVFAIPFLGSLLAFVVSFLAAGAALLSRLGSAPKPTSAATAL